MYTALIVDDEPLVQVGLQSMIDWSDLGIRLLPPASNGVSAWQTIEAHHPDLVITDIKMPLLDGLQLIAKCRAETSPCPAFIVLTSHEDFTFAREAMKHRVAEYLVKLELTAELLSQTVLRALSALDRPSTAPKPTQDTERQARESLWWDLLESVVPPDEAALATWVEPSWTGCTLTTAICLFGDASADTRPYAVTMLGEILGREFHVQTLLRNDRLVLLLGVEGFSLPAAEARFEASLAAALVMVKKYFNGEIVAGLGGARWGVASAPASYQEAVTALETLSHRGKAGVYRFSSPGPTLKGDEFRTGVEQALRAFDPVALAQWFDRAQEAIAVHGRLTDALDLGTAALYAVPAAIGQGEALVEEIFSANAEGPKSLYAVPTTAHVGAWLKKLEAGLAGYLERLGAHHQEKLIESMQRYVETHFRERLQLKSLAEQFRLSPNYAGSLFRRFSGRSFSEYVCEVKVAKAREMLSSRKYRIYEISEFLGFENTYYFSKVFRRVTGSSPRDFLSGNEGETE